MNIVVTFAIVLVCSAIVVVAQVLPKFSLISGSTIAISTNAKYSQIYGQYDSSFNPSAQDSHRITFFDNRIYTFHGYLKPGNDVWAFDTLTELWGWVGGKSNNRYPTFGPMGIASTSNSPGYRWFFGGDAHRARGEYVLYGGRTGEIVFGDLWTFCFETNSWSWLAGTSSSQIQESAYHGFLGVSSDLTTPGARSGQACAVFEPLGDFLAFGGLTGGPNTTAVMADMWSFDFLTLRWTWISGSSSSSSVAIAGLKCEWSSAFYPGRRQNSELVLNSDTKILFLFGGAGTTTLFSDMWAFDRNSLEWAWIIGGVTGIASPAASNITKGITDGRSLPARRKRMSMAYHQISGLILMHGGMGAGGNEPRLGDFWAFDTKTFLWTWIAGPSTKDSWANYTTGFEEPAGQSAASMAVDQASGLVYIFGGFGYVTPSLQGTHDHLWRVEIPLYSQMVQRNGSESQACLARIYKPPRSLNAQITSVSLSASRSSSSTKINKAIPLAKTLSTFGNLSSLLYYIIGGVVSIITIVVILFLVWSRHVKGKNSHIVTATISLPENSSFSQYLKTASTTEATNFSLATLSNTTTGIYLPGGLKLFPSSYRLEKEIARGGSGVVWVASALQPNLQTYGEKVVVKVPCGTVKDDRELDLFYQEISLMNAFKNELNIVKLLGYTEDPYSLILKYYPRGSLGKWMRREKFQLKQVLSFVNDISNAMAALHNNGVIHCDIKPDNVLIDKATNGYFAVLTDFGISQIVSEKLLVVKEYRVQTINGNSTAYAAPEVIFEFRAKIAGLRKSTEEAAVRDVYALGVLVCSVLNG
eukprot:Partr_v1_DN28120_c1_g1_i1_m55098 putative protein kinase kinase kinase